MPEQQSTFGSITARVLDGTDVEITRRGAPGRGPSRVYRLWLPEQIEAAALRADRGKTQDVKDEARALRWALGIVAKGGSAIG